MDRPAAVKLIRNTFESSFDKVSFINLIKNLVKYLDDSKNFTYQGNIIPDAYEQSIQTLERVGKYEDTDGNKIDLLIVRLRKEYSLERARTMQRNFVAWYLNGSRGGELKDAALVAFVSPHDRDWRFSLVRMDYNLVESPTGRVKVEKELTPARRYSFLVGEGESSHTAQVQLLPILEDDARRPLLSDFEKAFSIEVVAREFFTRYRELFHNVEEALENIVKKNEKVKADFTATGVDTVSFAKKLLGQVVFLYFLQKKGWFGVGRDAGWGTGPKDFLRRLFEKKIAPYDNFFNDVLEPLFYEALAVERTDDFYSRFNCKIPFLNGGLFDPINNYDWVHTDILLPNQLFSNNQKTKDGDVGTGILDVCDRYNFTVKEDEPLEKDVAVDPEMLGKVFENLLEVKDRKSKGTYYTPREIVHYMCQESLINYLDTAINTGDTPLVHIRPPQGKFFGQPEPEQGAFKTTAYRALIPRQDIESFVRMGELAIEHDTRVETYGKETERYSYKLPESVRRNAKLIDEKLAIIRVCDPAIGSGAFPVGVMTEIVRARNTLNTYLANDKDRTNYSFKRHAIQNCLYGVDIDPGAVEIAKLRLWLSLVVDEEDIKQIQPLPNLDYKIVCGNSLLGVEKTLFNLELFKDLERLKPLYFNETNAKKKQLYKGEINSLINQITNNNQTFDFEVYFSEVFHEKRGFDVVIANPPYGATIDKNELQKIIRKARDTTNSNSAAVFIDLSKNRLISDKGTLTFIVPKSLLFAEIWFSLVKSLIGKVTTLVDVEKAFEKVKLEQVFFSYNPCISTEFYLARKFLDSEFTTTTVIPNNMVSKFQAWICDVTEEELNIVRHVTTDFDFMRQISKTRRGAPIQKDLSAKGEFPVIGGKNIYKYGYRGTKGYLSKRVLNKYRQKVLFLNQPKIISQRLVAHIQNPYPHVQIMAAYDPKGLILSVDTVENTVLNDNSYDYRYILGLLNSKLISWYNYKFIFCSAIRTMDFDDYYIGKIPIPKLNRDQQQAIVSVIEKILSFTTAEDYTISESKQNKVKEYEKQIDQMVYELYGLTPEEIEIVEGSSK